MRSTPIIALAAAATITFGLGASLNFTAYATPNPDTALGEVTAKAATQTGSCVDGGGRTWTSKVVWGDEYTDSAGVRRVRADYAGWTTNGRNLPTDAAVRTYNGAEARLQELLWTGSHDYMNGTSWGSRNPRNPPSAPGKAQVTVTLGVDGDGNGNCTKAFVQPSAKTPMPTPPATGWLSGASGAEAAAGTFGTWRGSQVEIVGTWLNDPAVYPFGPNIAGCGDCGRLREWRGAVDVGISPATWRGWRSEADGGNDTFWRNTARNLRAARVGDAVTYIRPYYEFNGDWFPYSVTRGHESLFKQAWERTARLIRAEFPEAKVMLGVAASGGGNRIRVSDAYPASPDGLSIDFYNEWAFCTTQACFDQKIHDGAGADNSLEPLQRLARSKGDPLIISEWGNAGRARPASSGGGGEAPVFIDAFHGWLRRNAGTGPGQVAAEVYFNIGNYDARFELYINGQVTPVMPQTAARYRGLFRTN